MYSFIAVILSIKNWYRVVKNELGNPPSYGLKVS